MDDNNTKDINVGDNLIVKCEKSADATELIALQKMFCEMRKSGVIVLPKYCSVRVIPKDMSYAY